MAAAGRSSGVVRLGAGLRARGGAARARAAGGLLAAQRLLGALLSLAPAPARAGGAAGLQTGAQAPPSGDRERALFRGLLGGGRGLALGLCHLRGGGGAGVTHE